MKLSRTRTSAGSGRPNPIWFPEASPTSEPRPALLSSRDGCPREFGRNLAHRSRVVDPDDPLHRRDGLFSFGAPPPGVTILPYADKIEHAIAYFATTLSFLFAAVWRPGRGPGRWPWMGLWFPVAAIAAGALIEFLQGMTPTREAQALDLIAEVIGTMAAVAIHSTIRRISRPGPRIEM